MRRKRKMTQAILPSYRTFSESKGKQLQAKLKTCEKTLHAEGWSHTAISAYLQTPRHRVCQSPPARSRRLVRYTWTPPQLGISLQTCRFGFFVRCFGGH